MESDRPEPWSIDDAPPPYIEKMLSGIVALFFTIEKVDAKFKASQNKSRDDVSGVVDGLLSNSLTAEAGRIAEMKSK
jgi:transcriptional regulator